MLDGLHQQIDRYSSSASRIAGVEAGSGCTGLTLRSDVLEVTVLPEIGGKIARITHLATATDLLVPTHRPLKTLLPGSKWVDGDTSGMDDCFPNIDEGVHPETGGALPQMGEWVYQGWQVHQVDSSSVALELDGVALPYRARKAVRLSAPDTVLFEYSVRNTGDTAFSYMWSAHPLIRVEDEFEIAVPPTTLTYVTFPDDGLVREWPLFGSVDLSRDWIPTRSTLKLFLRGLDEGWCELRMPGYSLRFDFDPDLTPVVGLWFNNFGFPAAGPRFRCIAVEPCTAATDMLHLVGDSTRSVLKPREEAAWWMSLRITPQSKRDHKC